ncbi:hypothetical protein AAFF_G00403350, partial [Aldrovandia affinis]
MRYAISCYWLVKHTPYLYSTKSLALFRVSHRNNYNGLSPYKYKLLYPHVNKSFRHNFTRPYNKAPNLFCVSSFFFFFPSPVSSSASSSSASPSSFPCWLHHQKCSMPQIIHSPHSSISTSTNNICSNLLLPTSSVHGTLEYMELFFLPSVVREIDMWFSVAQLVEHSV